MRVHLMVTCTIPEDGIDVNRIEAQIMATLRETGQALWTKTLAQLAGRAQRRYSGTSKGPTTRMLITQVGTVRLTRQRRLDADGTSFCPLDRLLGLQSGGSEATRAVRRRAVELACEYPYQQAAWLLSRELGERIGKSRLHRWVQQDGQRLMTQVVAEWQALQQAAAPPRQGAAAPAAVVLEADATSLASQDPQHPGRLWAKLGLAYTGKEVYSKAHAKVAKYRLLNKLLCGGVTDWDTFGQQFFTTAEQQLHVSQIPHQLFLADGEEAIESLRQLHFPASHFQLDWGHLTRNIRQAMRQNERLTHVLLRRLYDGQGATIPTLLRQKLKTLQDEQQEITQLLTYVSRHHAALYTVHQLKDTFPDAQLLNVGSGAIEKNVEVIISRRFKKQGMCWTQAGANHLLKLRILKRDAKAWDEFWNT